MINTRQLNDWVNNFDYLFFHTILPLLIIAFIVALIIYMIWEHYQWKKTKLTKGKKQNSHGIIFGLQNRKVIYSKVENEGHICVFGGSGIGKTSSILIPTLRSWTDSSLVIDISGDINKNVNIPDKLLYEPQNSNTSPFNVFGAIDELKNETAKNEALEELAYLLMPEDENMSENSQYFHKEGRKILTGSLIAFYSQGLDFVEICELIVGSSYISLFEKIDETQHDKAMLYINSFEGANEKNTQGCKQACDESILLFATNDTVKQTIRRPKENEECFTPATLENKNVFVVIPDSKLEQYKSLVNLITAQSLQYLSERPIENTQTILLCLDEFASFGRMEITPALRKLRKRHVRIMVLTQSMADIDLIYGHNERMSMLNNFLFKVVLSATDTETQEYFAKLLGYKDTKKYSVSKNSNNITNTETEDKEWQVEPADFGKLDKNLIVLHPVGFLKLKKNFYYK